MPPAELVVPVIAMVIGFALAYISFRTVFNAQQEAINQLTKEVVNFGHSQASLAAQLFNHIKFGVPVDTLPMIPKSKPASDVFDENDEFSDPALDGGSL